MPAGPFEQPMDRRLLKGRRAPSHRSLVLLRKQLWEEKAKYSKTYEQWQSENPGVIPILLKGE